jgi:hypothetical protein
MVRTAIRSFSRLPVQLRSLAVYAAGPVPNDKHACQVAASGLPTMTMMRRHALALIGLAVVLAFAGPAAAQPYRWVDSQGSVHYSQTPPQPSDLGPPQQASPGDLGALVDEVLELSGVRRAIADIPDGIQAQLQRERAPQLPPAAWDKLGEIMLRAFSPEAMYGRLRNSFVRQADAERLAAMLALLRSPLCREMNALELSANSPEGRAGLSAFAADLLIAKPPEARVTLIRRLEAAAGSSELQADVAIAVIRSMAEVFEAVAPSSARHDASQVEDMLRKIRVTIVDTARVTTAVQGLYVYRSVPDATLDEYVRLHEADPGRWFSGLLRRAFVESVSAAATGAAQEMIKTLPRGPERRT